MAIVTLTTDYGLKDYYVAQLKGAILTQTPSVQLVDISHQIPQHNIVQAAYIVRNAYFTFPEGSIHIIGVNNHYAKESSFLVTKHNKHYFILPDNGLLSLIFEELPNAIYSLRIEPTQCFLIKNLYATVIRHLLEDGALADIGQEVKTIDQRITLKPVTSASRIRGSVIHIDYYENVILNITSDLFHQLGHGRPFELYFKRYDPITKLSTHYQDVPIGETLCLFNSANYLEIAINMGKAASMLGLQIDDTIQIDFKNR